MLLVACALWCVACARRVCVVGVCLCAKGIVYLSRGVGCVGVGVSVSVLSVFVRIESKGETNRQKTRMILISTTNIVFTKSLMWTKKRTTQLGSHAQYVSNPFHVGREKLVQLPLTVRKSKHLTWKKRTVCSKFMFSTNTNVLHFDMKCSFAGGGGGEGTAGFACADGTQNGEDRPPCCCEESGFLPTTLQRGSRGEAPEHTASSSSSSGMRRKRKKREEEGSSRRASSSSPSCSRCSVLEIWTYSCPLSLAVASLPEEYRNVWLFLLRLSFPWYAWFDSGYVFTSVYRGFWVTSCSSYVEGGLGPFGPFSLPVHTCLCR